MELVGIDGAAAKWQTGGRHRRARRGARATTRSGSTTTSTTCRGRRTRPCSSAGRRWRRSASAPPACGSARWSAATATANRRCWPRSPRTVDVISGGRLDWGIGAGWYENEYKGYGFEFPPPKDRIGMLRECVEIVRSMWTEPETTFDGKYYQLSRAQCDPKPLQSPHPPIWIGGGGEQLTLRVVARYADCSNFGGKPDEWARKREILKGHCAAVGRDEETIRKTWSPEMFIRSTEAEIARRRQQEPAGANRSRAGARATSWARPSRCARRSRPTSTSVAPASSRGAATTRHRDDGAVRHARSCPTSADGSGCDSSLPLSRRDSSPCPGLNPPRSGRIARPVPEPPTLGQ